jgi:hypothetical protein
MGEMSGSLLELCGMVGAAFVGFMAGVVVGFKIHGDEPTYRDSDPTVNAGFGPDYSFRRKEQPKVRK